MSEAQTFFEINEIPSLSEFLKEGIKLVCFGANWCQPCHKQKSILDEVFNNMNNKVGFAYVDVDLNIDLATEYGIHSIPSILLYKEGKKEEMFKGVITQSVIEDKLRNLL